MDLFLRPVKESLKETRKSEGEGRRKKEGGDKQGRKHGRSNESANKACLWIGLISA